MPPTTLGLIGLRASQIAGNTYTLVRAARELRKLGESDDRIDALSSWWDAPYHRHRLADAFDFSVAGPAAMNAGARYLLKRGYR